MAAQRKLTDDQRAEIARKWFAKEATQRELSYMYDVSPNTINLLISQAKMDQSAERVINR